MDLARRVIAQVREAAHWDWGEYHSAAVYQYHIDFYDLRDVYEWMQEREISLQRDLVRTKTRGTSQIAITFWASMDEPTWAEYRMRFL